MNIKDINNDYTVLNNTLKNNEYMFMTYDTLISVRELGTIQYLMENYDTFKNKLNLDVFIEKSNPYIIRLLLERKEKDIIKWLIKDMKDYEELYEELYDYINYTNSNIVTDFCLGIPKLLCSKSVSKLVISIDNRDINGLKILNDIFYEYVDDKVFIVDNQESTIIKYIKDKKYTLLMTDEIDILNGCLKFLEGKSVCIPYTGYNFDVIDGELVDDIQLLMSKHKFEITSITHKFNLGFIEPFNMTEEMFAVG